MHIVWKGGKLTFDGKNSGYSCIPIGLHTLLTQSMQEHRLTCSVKLCAPCMCLHRENAVGDCVQYLIFILLQFEV